MRPAGEHTTTIAPRERLHGALIELCAERGFAQISVEGLCRRAAVERGDFERDYADLED
jgi:hypothetical protein